MPVAPARDQTPLDEMRWLLDQADNRVGALETGSTADTIKLLRMLDDIERLYNDLQRSGVDLRAEESRLETLQLILQRKAGVVVRLLRPEGGIAAVRARLQPPAANWWWQLDAYVAQQRRKTLRSLAVTATIVVVILAALAVAYQTFLRPDPRLIAHMDRLSNVRNALDRADTEGALRAADDGLVEFPGDGELLLWRGALLVLLGRQQEAQAAFDAARPGFADEPTYLITRASVRLQASDVTGAYADAKAAVALAPENAQAYLALGSAQELRSEVNAASDSYSKAASLAAAQKNTQLEAMAKVRLAMMLQNPPMFPNSGTPEATPTR